MGDAMGVENILPQKGIKVILGGEEKFLGFNMKSVSILAEKYGTMTNAFNSLQTISGKSERDFTLPELEALSTIVYASLIMYNKTITYEYVQDKYQLGDIITILPEIFKAFADSLKGAYIEEGDSDPQKA